MRKTIEIINGEVANPLYALEKPINLTICKGEQIAVVGNNAAGKTRLIDILTGKYPVKHQALKYDFYPSQLKLASENIRYITFRDSYGDYDGQYYLQLRWNQIEIDKETPIVKDLLDKSFLQSENFCGKYLDEDNRKKLTEQRIKLRDTLYDLFKIKSLSDKYIITLSSGELRKFQIMKSLLYLPKLLIIDNPFIGLDEKTRNELSELLSKLVSEYKLQIILILAKTDLIPNFITHILPIEGMEIKEKIRIEEWENKQKTDTTCPLELIDSLPVKDIMNEVFYPKEEKAEILKFNNINIRYGERTILKDLNWTVREGECWSLSGENGTGKSTLLSLVCADNPQGYACDIELFGHKRGTGESIWEIKRHIGYVSPEMHRSYIKDIPAINIVASGLFDTIGLYVKPKPEQLELCLLWMKIFSIDKLADKSFLQISSGEQRLCLLARAFVKDPELLILDEPLHGLDELNCNKVRRIIDRFMMRPHKTLLFVTHFKSELPKCITHHKILTRN